MPSRLSNFKLVYLNGIFIASIIVVIFEYKINYRLRTGDNFPDEEEAIVVEIKRFCLLRGIGRIIE
jgi:hypothetical protein